MTRNIAINRNYSADIVPSQGGVYETDCCHYVKITTPAGKSRLNYINSPKFAACVLLEVFVYDFLRPVFGIGVEWDTSQWCRR